MTNVLILDTETDGLDPKVNKVIEVACIQYNIIKAAPIQYYASLIHAKENLCEHINGISVDLLESAPSKELVWKNVNDLVFSSKYIIAHNARFDKSFMSEDLQKKRPWVCSMLDMKFPKGQKAKNGRISLVALALAHGVGVVHAHRAMSDVDMLSRLFTRVTEMGYSLEEMIEKSFKPKAKFIALVSYENKDLAKDEGFEWDGKNKQWHKTMFVEDVKDFPFKVKKVEDVMSF